MIIALILTICSAGAPVERCDDYIVETYDAVIPCVVEMAAHRQVQDDRYLSCAAVEPRYLVDRRDGRTVAQIIADLNRETVK